MSQTNCSVYKSNWSVSKRTASLSQDKKESTADALCDYQNLTLTFFLNVFQWNLSLNMC